MTWLSKRRPPSTRRRTRPTLDWLEGRQLLANAAVATTLDSNGNPLLVAVQTGGTVAVNIEQPTNDPTNPYQYTGYQTLPGVTALTVTATTLSNGDPVVYAKPKNVSYLFANEYVSTGDPANPHAWSGWTRVGGDFVSTSATAVTSATTSAVFAIGADSQVYAAPVIPATTPGAASTLGTFQKVSPFGAASIAVTADRAGSFEVAALAGTHTYVYGNNVTLTGESVTDTGWQQLGNFVATSIDLTPGLNTTVFGGNLGDRLFLFAVGTDGNVYYDPLTPDTTTGNRDSTAYKVIGSGNVVSSRTSISGDYMTVYELETNGSIYQQQLVATGQIDNPIALSNSYGATQINGPYYTGTPDFVATAIDLAPQTDGGFTILTSSSDGTAQVTHQFAHAALEFPGYYTIPNTYTGFADVSVLGAHPIATSNGPNGGQVVVSLGSDGTVYASTAAAPATAGAAPTFAAFSSLPGITATSIAAAQLDSTGEMAVYALTNTSSLVYENQYLSTGNTTTPFAWTGWRPLGTFVARSIAAAYTPGASQATVFAIGLDNVVAATDRSANQADPTTATFTPLTGVFASTVAVRGFDNATVELVASSGTTGYGYTRFYQPSGVTTPSTTSPPVGQWYYTGNYVVKNVAAGTNGKYAIGIGPAGYQAATSSYQATTSTVGTNYVPLQFRNLAAYSVAYNGYRVGGLLSIDDSTGNDATVELIVPTYGVLDYSKTPAFVETVTGGGSTSSTAVDSPKLSTTPLLRTLGASTAATESSYFVGDNLGAIYYTQFATSSTATAPTFTDFALIGTLPT